jgi:prepilin-type N-terminal cleavage/methylation domain-containing protein
MGSRLHQDQRGFTLIELLVVILIVGILFAIVLPVFLNQRAKAQDAEAKAAVSMVETALIDYHHDRDTFAGADRITLAAIEPAVLDVPPFTIADADDDGFELRVESSSGTAGGGPFIVAHSGGGSSRSCATPGRGGCPASGEW